MSSIENITSKWRDIAVGSIITLFVTIVGGIVVYYITRSGLSIQPKEDLIYEIEPITRFKAENTEVAFTSVNVKNKGEIAANDVVITAESDVDISDQRISMSSDPAGSYSVIDSTSKTISVKTPLLAPNESINVKILFSEIPTSDIRVGVKSAKTVGEISKISEDTATNTVQILEFLPEFVIVAVTMQGFLVYLWWRRREWRSNYHSINNTAFLYLHSGFVEDAKQLLTDKVKSEGVTAHELANLGLCYALEENYERADKLYRAANFYSRNDHQKSIIFFNRALSAFCENNLDEGQRLLKEAISLSGDEIKEYCDFSEIVSSLSENGDVSKIFDQVTEKNA